MNLFLRPSPHDNSPIIPENNELVSPQLQNKSVSTVKHALFKGTLDAYKEEQRPYTSITMPLKPAALGEFFYLKMMEIIYLGFLFNINPFDQPAVESYKYKTRQLLEL